MIQLPIKRKLTPEQKEFQKAAKKFQKSCKKAVKEIQKRRRNSMKIENNKIVECTEDELYEHYLKAGLDELFSFTDYRKQCEAHGTKVIIEGIEKKTDNEQEEDESKRCPFCGGEVEVRYLSHIPMWLFECQNEECRAMMSFDCDRAHSNPNEAFELWNRRVK